MADIGLYAIAAVSLGAASVNGALGYGYSSLTTPVALLVVTARVLNPAIVLVEVVVNLYALFLGRRSVRRVLPRVLPLVLGLVPGVLVGSLLLAHVAPTWAKLMTYSLLLPLVLIQGAGRAWPIRNETRAAVPLGAGVGLLYSLTTISGPPLAAYFNNQRYDRDDFRVGLAIVRTAESLFTLTAYLLLGVFSTQSLALAGWIAPGVAIGMPLGFWLVRHVDAEKFRRVCITFDVWIVGFGLSRMLDMLGLVDAPWSYVVLLSAVVVDLLLVRFYFQLRRPRVVDLVPRALEPTS